MGRAEVAMLKPNIHRTILASTIGYPLVNDPHLILTDDLMRLAIIILAGDIGYSLTGWYRKRRLRRKLVSKETRIALVA